MAKKTKPIEKQRKSYKRRGIFYLVMVVLLIIGTVVVNINAVERVLNRVVFPSSETLTIEDEKREVYSEISTEEGTDVSAYYYLDENGEKVYVSPYLKLSKISYVKTSFETDAKVRLTLIQKGVSALMVVFIILLVIYLLRLSYYISNTDAEWKQRVGDKMTNLRVKKDRLATKLSKKKNK